MTSPKIPKYLNVGTTSRMVPLTERGKGGRQEQFFLEISMVLHLLVLNVIVFKVDQVRARANLCMLSREFMSHCR